MMEQREFLQLVPVAFASLSLLQEGPYESVDDVGLVLLQPVARSRNDIETEVVPDVETAGLGHFLLQEGVALAPEQQHGRPDVVVAQGEGAGREKHVSISVVLKASNQPLAVILIIHNVIFILAGVIKSQSCKYICHCNCNMD